MVNGELHATCNTDRQPDTQACVFSLVYSAFTHVSNNTYAMCGHGRVACRVYCAEGLHFSAFIYKSIEHKSGTI